MLDSIELVNVKIDLATSLGDTDDILGSESESEPSQANYPYTQAKAQQSEIERVSARLGPIASPCANPVAYNIKVSPENIKAGVDGVIEADLTVLVVVDPACKKQTTSVGSVVKRLSLSFVGLIMLNLFREIMYSFLNIKDVLDLVKFDAVSEQGSMARLDEWFFTSDCQIYLPFSHDGASFDSHLRVKTWLLGNYLEHIRSHFMSKAPQSWLGEYAKQEYAKLPQAVREHQSCRFRLIVSEYFVLVLSCLLVLGKALPLVVWCFAKAPTSKKVSKAMSCLAVAHGKCRNLLLASVLLAIFYNVAAFVSVVKLARTMLFGLADFGVLAVRGWFVVYPLFSFATAFDSDLPCSEATNPNSQPKRKHPAKNIRDNT